MQARIGRRCRVRHLIEESPCFMCLAVASVALGTVRIPYQTQETVYPFNIYKQAFARWAGLLREFGLFGRPKVVATIRRSSPQRAICSRL
jgi:hypothetical protein